MILADVNMLVGAFRPDSPHYPRCKPWLDRIVAGEARFGISPLVLSAVVRIATNPRAFTPPSAIDETFGYCADLLRQPHAVIVEPGEHHWSIFERLCVQTNMRGPNVTDAWFAALAIEHGCTWITFDRDYARFPGLNWQEPD